MTTNHENGGPFDFSQIPSDFPRVASRGAVSGVHPKILVTKFEGQYYEAGTSSPEVYERWLICEDLAQQLSQKSLESKNGKRAHMSETEILRQYFERLIATGWTSKEEAAWTINRAARIIDWPAIE